MDKNPQSGSDHLFPEEVKLSMAERVLHAQAVESMREASSDSKIPIFNEPDSYAYVKTTNDLKAAYWFSDIYGVENPFVELVKTAENGLKVYRCKINLPPRYAGKHPRFSLYNALMAIANMVVDESTDHAQLSALCIAIAKIAIKNISPVKKEA